jgi:hypothetical protein
MHMHRHGGRIALLAAALLTLGIVGSGTVMAAQPAPAKVAKAVKAGAVERLARHIVHGTVVIQRADGTLQTLQIDRGTIATVGGGTITIAEPGGSQTVATDAQTRVRKNGAKSSVSALVVGDKVLVISDLATGSPVADLVIVPRPRPTPLPAQAAP